MEEPLPLTTFHIENEEQSLLRKTTPTQIKGETHDGEFPFLSHNEEADGEEAACSRYAITTSPVVLKTVDCLGLNLNSGTVIRI